MVWVQGKLKSKISNEKGRNKFNLEVIKHGQA